MYLFETGLGEIFKPRSQRTPPPKQPPQPPPKIPTKPPPKEGKVVKDGHWRWCPAATGRSLSCDVNLKVRFRRSFDGFLREVENAYGRWMARPTARMLVKKLQKDLKQWHQDMLSQKLLDNDPINFVAGLYYRRSNGTWLLDGSSLRQWWRLIDL